MEKTHRPGNSINVKPITTPRSHAIDICRSINRLARIDQRFTQLRDSSTSSSSSMSIDVKLHYDLAIAITSKEKSSLKFLIGSDILLIRRIWLIIFSPFLFLWKRENYFKKKCRKGLISFQESMCNLDYCSFSMHLISSHLIGSTFLSAVYFKLLLT